MGSLLATATVPRRPAEALHPEEMCRRVEVSEHPHKQGRLAKNLERGPPRLDAHEAVLEHKLARSAELRREVLRRGHHAEIRELRAQLFHLLPRWPEQIGEQGNLLDAKRSVQNYPMASRHCVHLCSKESPSVY